MKLILASNSSRRKELLSKLNIDFTIISSDYEESLFSSDPILVAETFAKGKAKAVFDNLDNQEDVLVLGSDTVVCLNGEILGKPIDKKDAFNTLKKLSGKTHNVISGYALITKNSCVVGHDCTVVEFNDLASKLINEYIDSGLPFGKAGSYGIQDGYPLVKKYDGSLNNVIGLPTEKIFPLINKIIKIN